MLAGEEFSDHPRSVCPVVAGFLRSYNDGVHDEQRADLYRFAAEAVGTRAGAEVTAARARLCHEWISNHLRELVRGPGRLMPTRFRGWPVLTARPDDPSAGTLAGRLAARLARRGRQGAHASALALVERMLEAGRDRPHEDPCRQEVAYDRRVTLAAVGE